MLIFDSQHFNARFTFYLFEISRLCVSSSPPMRVMYRAPVAYLKIRVGEVFLWSVPSKGVLAILATAQSLIFVSEKPLHILQSATSQLKVPGVTVNQMRSLSCICCSAKFHVFFECAMCSKLFSFLWLDR